MREGYYERNPEREPIAGERGTPSGEELSGLMLELLEVLRRYLEDDPEGLARHFVESVGSELTRHRDPHVRALLLFGLIYHARGVKEALRRVELGIPVEVRQPHSRDLRGFRGHLIGVVGVDETGEERGFQGIAVLERNLPVAVTLSLDGEVVMHPAHFNEANTPTSPEVVGRIYPSQATR